jgi:hypothetical protein
MNPDQDKRRDSGMPGGGAGRTDTPGRTGVYPASGPMPEQEAELQPMASWGQGKRGAAGYQDHGGSEISDFGDQKGLGGTTAGPSGEPEPERGTEAEKLERHP